MLLTKLKVVAVVLIAVSVVAAGGGLAAVQFGEGEQPAVRQKVEPKVPPALDAKKPAQINNQPRLDLLGDSLPTGAVARIGTVRLFRDIWQPSTEPGPPHLESYLAYTPDGKVLICSDYNKAITIWDTVTGKEIRRLVPKDGKLLRFAVAPDGKTMVTFGRGSEEMRLWDIPTGNEIRQIPIPKDSVSSVAFSKDGTTLAAAGPVMRLWDVATWREVSQIPAVGSQFVYLPDGKTIISASYPLGLRWWDTGTGLEIRHVALGKKSITAGPIISVDGAKLAAVLNNTALHIWNAATGEELSQTLLHKVVNPEKDKNVTSYLCFSPDGKILAWSGSGPDPEVQKTVLFSADTGRQLQHRQRNYNVMAMAFSPDGKVLAQLTWDNAIYLLDATTGQPAIQLPRPPGLVLSVAFMPDGKRLIAGCRGGYYGSWDPITGVPIGVAQGPPEGFAGPGFPNTALSFSVDRKNAALVDAKDILYVWEAATGKLNSKINDPPVGQGPAVFSPDGKIVAVRHNDDVIRLWDVASGKLVGRTQNMEPALWFVRQAFSPDGQILAMGCAIISLWDLAQGKERSRLSWSGNSPVTSVQFTSDGKWLVSAHFTARKMTRPRTFHYDYGMWQVDARMRRFHGDSLLATSLAISPDGKTIAAFASDAVVYLWELASGRARGQFAGHHRTDGSFDGSVAFSPHGRLLASGCSDLTALVWDVTGISPDGKLLPRNVAPEELKRLWADLAGSDAVKAYRAMWTMVAGGRQSVPFLAERLRPVAQPDNQRVARLIADLDSEQFKTRTEASNALKQLGELAEPAFRKALEGKTTLETRQRLTLLLDELRNRPFLPQQLQILRAVEALENLGTPEARQLLTVLATGAGSDGDERGEGVAGAAGQSED